MISIIFAEPLSVELFVLLSLGLRTLNHLPPKMSILLRFIYLAESIKSDSWLETDTVYLVHSLLNSLGLMSIIFCINRDDKIKYIFVEYFNTRHINTFLFTLLIYSNKKKTFQRGWIFQSTSIFPERISTATATNEIRYRNMASEYRKEW